MKAFSPWKDCLQLNWQRERKENSVCKDCY